MRSVGFCVRANVVNNSEQQTNKWANRNAANFFLSISICFWFLRCAPVRKVRCFSSALLFPVGWKEKVGEFPLTHTHTNARLALLFIPHADWLAASLLSRSGCVIASLPLKLVQVGRARTIVKCWRGRGILRLAIHFHTTVHCGARAQVTDTSWVGNWATDSARRQWPATTHAQSLSNLSHNS